MSNHHEEHHSGHTGDGFLMGVIVGAAGMFLLGTKSGQNILKVMSEQGLDGIQNLLEEYNLNADEEDLDEESPEVVEAVKEKSKDAKEHIEHATSDVEKATEEVKDVEEVVKPPKKRFFKRFRK